MKTFEEKWTAWIDDQLSGKELADFEASLPDRAAAEAEKQSARQLGTLLKRELGPSLMTNEDFFNHQLRERIAREDVATSPRRTSGFTGWWTVPRLLWSGATAVALFVVCAVFVLRDDNGNDESYTSTTSTILNARIDPAAAVSPDATITMFESKEDRITVLWTEGLKTLPSEYAAK